jgi:hypothetical protein
MLVNETYLVIAESGFLQVSSPLFTERWIVDNQWQRGRVHNPRESVSSSFLQNVGPYLVGDSELTNSMNFDQLL